MTAVTEALRVNVDQANDPDDFHLPGGHARIAKVVYEVMSTLVNNIKGD